MAGGEYILDCVLLHFLESNMQRRTITYLVITVCLALTLVACKEKGAKTLGDYFEAKSDYAVVLDNWLSQSNPNWRVIPIYGPVYEPGTPMEPGSTEPLTDECLVPGEQVINDPMTTFPSIDTSRTFDITAIVPAAIIKAKSLVVSGGGGFNSSKESHLSYTDLTQRAVRRDKFDENLMQLDCLAVIAGKEVTIVRGQISGKEIISSTKTLGANANVKVLGDEALTVSYNSSGGYKLEDNDVQPKYYYVVNRIIEVDIPENATMTMRRAIIEDFLRTESTGDLEYKDSRPTDGQVESFVRQTRGATN